MFLVGTGDASYPAYEDEDEALILAIYAVTHVVYVLNATAATSFRAPGYRRIRLLKRSLVRTLEQDDPETTGELLDSLKSFGLAMIKR